MSGRIELRLNVAASDVDRSDAFLDRAAVPLIEVLAWFIQEPISKPQHTCLAECLA